MLTVEILCVGKLRESFLREGCERYRRMASAYCDIKITELPESKIQPRGPLDVNRMVEEESRAIDKALASRKGRVIALCIDGVAISSARFSEEASAALRSGIPLLFVIGGSHGLTKEFVSKASLRLSLSAMTFPHQLTRLLLLEQVYRAFNTASGGKYAK